VATPAVLPVKLGPGACTVQDGWPGTALQREALRDAARDLVYAKPPGEHRAAFWEFCAGGAEALQQFSQPGSEKDKAQYDQMMLDVKRTPHLLAGQEDALVGILAGYCSRRSLDGSANFEHYVQGMHLLAACPLWAGLDQREALAVFEFALDRLCSGYYADKTFATFKRDVLVAEALIEERLPQLALALRTAGVPTMTIAFDPLLCLFTYHLPCASALRLWDVLLLEGDTAVFAALLVLLEELLPEAVGSSRQEVLAWQNFPFVERLHERFAALSVEGVEAMLGRVRALLEEADGEEGEGPPGLRRRVHELRKDGIADCESEVQDGCVGGWWSQVRGWWWEHGDGSGPGRRPGAPCAQM